MLAHLPTPTIVKAVAPAMSSPSPVRVEPPNVRAPGSAQPLQGQWSKSTGTTAKADDLRRQGFRRGLGTAALVLGLLAVVVVLFVLPKLVATQAPARYAPAASKTKSPATPVEKKEIDFAALARAKQQAEEQRAPIEERMQKLRERAVEQWGGDRLSRARFRKWPQATSSSKRASTFWRPSTMRSSSLC